MVRLPTACCASAISESVPPSPLLSARMMNSTYLTVTMKISAQISSETIPTISVACVPVCLVCSSEALSA